LKFDLDQFCRHFKLQRATAYYAIVYLERTGHWTLSEDVDISTKVQIRIDRNELYDLDLPEPKMALLLETLMRRYTGLFSYPVPIDEDYIASRIGVQVPALRQLLYKLSLEHIIRYVPCDHATVLYLHHDRLRPKNVNMDPERYALLKDSGLARMQKMMDYVSEEDVCRSSYLLEYFGQSESTDCGTCDVCRGRTSASPVSLRESLEKYINDEMNGTYTLDDIKGGLSASVRYSYSEIFETLRELIDMGKVPMYR
jgi:ATP-dependent DNA helicase RecQ